MSTTSVRIDRTTHERLKHIAENENKPIGEVIADFVEKYEKEKFWQGARDAYARLRADPEAWRSYQEEVALWDATSFDGLENEEPYTENELKDVLEPDPQMR